MVTYPSTHGVFEAAIREICAIVHAHGGQVYMDGANLNAQVGLTSPGRDRRRRVPPEPAQDVLHPARRRRPRRRPDRRRRASGAVPAQPPVCAPTPDRRPASARSPPRRSAAARSCRSPTPTSRMMGGPGLKRATEVAILNANYIAHRLRAALPGPLHRPRRHGRARVHHRLPRLRGRRRRHGRGHRQAPAGLRLSTRRRCPGRSPAR